MNPRRPAAIAALVLGATSIAFAAVIVVRDFPLGLVVLAFVPPALIAGWYGLVHRGLARAAGLGAALVLCAAVIALVIAHGSVAEGVVSSAGLLASLGAARIAFRTDAALPLAAPPSHPVLLFNPKSGGGKAERFRLAERARERRIEPVELRPGDELGALVRAAIERGADALAMAGGDGSQAVVAAIAAERGLPYACIPAGTRNHFALDLGVDRDDVVGALDALVDGGERVIDLAEVNGRVFVNNVSLGVYAEAVQRGGYRDAKLRTILDTVPDVLGPGGEEPDLRWTSVDGSRRRTAATILVSNNPYRLGSAIGSGTRPRLDAGLLGIAAVGPGDAGADPPRLEQWTASSFEVDSGGPVPAGIDGEAVTLEPPLRFRSRPGALRVRIAPGHPGASPSAAMPASEWAVPGALARIAFA
jgi:diacylglycerol kinase family enzyme